VAVLDTSSASPVSMICTGNAKIIGCKYFCIMGVIGQIYANFLVFHECCFKHNDILITFIQLFRGDHCTAMAAVPV
jgi:hypothetical protein